MGASGLIVGFKSIISLEEVLYDRVWCFASTDIQVVILSKPLLQLSVTREGHHSPYEVHEDTYSRNENLSDQSGDSDVADF